MSAPEAALTSISTTPGATLPCRDEQALILQAGVHGAGASAAGHAPSGANAHGTGRWAPLAAML